MAEPISSILVVDDNAMSRKVVQFQLARDGHNVLCAASGEEALEIIEREHVDLVFLDLLMEGMSGSEVLATLKRDPRYCDIPVVIVSGVEDPAIIDDCIQAGARDFLPKPVITETLKDVIADLVTHAFDAGPALSEFALLDADVLVQLDSDSGSGTAEKFQAHFEEHYSDRLSEIRAAQDQSDTDARRRATICLKGSARTLGLSRLTAACRNIERACDGNNALSTTEATDQLNQHIDESLAALRAYMASA